MRTLSPLENAPHEELGILSKHSSIPLPQLDQGVMRSYSAVHELMSKKKNLKIKFRRFKRLSPFLLLIPFLLVLFPYMLITGAGVIESEWLLLILFPFIIIYVLFIDFWLWNYFEGKKKFFIWLIELPLSFLTVNLLI